MKKTNHLERKNFPAIFSLTFLTLFVFFTGIIKAQVNIGWQRTFNSSPNLVDYGREIRIDNSSNVFVCGHSFVNDGQEGVTTILKYSDDGKELWTKFTEPGVNMEDFQIDQNGNLFVSGDKWNGSNFDILLIKFDNEGNELWRKSFDGGHWDRSFAIVLDNSGNVYQTGITWYQPQYYDIVTVKYNQAGNIVWSKTYTSNGQASDYGKKIILDHSGNIYVSGFADSEIAIIKYNPSGDKIWDRRINMNASYDELFSSHIAADANDNLLICGTVYNVSTRSDIFTAKYDSSGNQLWSNLWNGANNDSDVVSGDAIGDEAMAIDNSGNVFVAGTSINPSVSFGDNVVTLKYNSSGILQWSHIYDGPASDWDRPYSIKVGNSGSVYICGETVEAMTSLVPLDYLTFKLSGSGQLQWVKTFDGVGNFFDKAAAMIINDREDVFVTGISSQDGEIFGGNRDIVTIKYVQNSTSVISGNEIISGYRLEQNYPNPFNPETKIRFSLPSKNFIKLKIYNSLGKEIQTLVNEELIAGEYEYKWNASGLQSGVYFYKLVTGNFSETKTMILLK